MALRNQPSAGQGGRGITVACGGYSDSWALSSSPDLPWLLRISSGANSWPSTRNVKFDLASHRCHSAHDGISGRELFEWKEALISVRPETFTRWHRQGFKFWRFKSRPLGRPRIPQELRQRGLHCSAGLSEGRWIDFRLGSVLTRRFCFAKRVLALCLSQASFLHRGREDSVAELDEQVRREAIEKARSSLADVGHGAGTFCGICL